MDQTHHAIDSSQEFPSDSQKKETFLIIQVTHSVKGAAWGGPLKVTIQCHHNSNLHPLVQTHAPLSKSGFYEMQSQLWTIKLLHWGKWKIFFLVPLRSFEFTTVIHDLKFRF